MLESNINIPNLLSITRVLSCGFFLVIGENKILFLLLVVLIGITDVLDGYIARKYKCESEIGAQLDSVGDFVFYISLVAYLWVFKKELILDKMEILLLAVSVKFLPLLLSLIRNKKIVFLHTLLNKMSGLIVLIGIVLVVLFNRSEIINLIAVIIIIAGIEESVIHIIKKNPDKNIRSVFLSL